MNEIAENPYPGSRAFRLEDQVRFFGRSAESAAIAALWQSNRLTLMSGPPACGKTSLLQAGVYPLVSAARADVLAPGRLDATREFPVAALPEHNAYTLALLRAWAPQELPGRLAGQTVGEFIGRRAGRHGRMILAAIDQAEGLLAGPHGGRRAAMRREFLSQLARAVADEPRLHLLIVCRAEALELITSALGAGARHEVTALTPDAAIDAIEGPVAGSGRSFADGAAARLVTELRTSRLVAASGAGERYVTAKLTEPLLLQVICTRLWRELPPELAVITARDARVYGDPDAALAAHWGDAITAVAAEHDMTGQRLRAWLLTTFVTGPGSRRAEYSADAGEGAATGGMPNAVVQALADRRLLISELRSGLRWYQLLSDRLIEPLRRAADRRPPLPSSASLLRAALRAVAAGDLELAEQRAGQALSARPEPRVRAEAESLLGDLAYERDRLHTASARYETAASLYAAAGDTAMAARALAAAGRALLGQEETAVAVSKLRAALARLPNDPLTQTQFALALWQVGEGPAAVAILTSVLSVDGANAEALRTRGEILADLGSSRAAKLDLERQESGDRPSTSAAHGLVLAQLGDHPAAQARISAALTQAPRNGSVLLYAARASALGGDQAGAGELARRALDATDPPLSRPHRELARTLADVS